MFDFKNKVMQYTKAIQLLESHNVPIRNKNGIRYAKAKNGNYERIDNRTATIEGKAVLKWIFENT